MTVLLVFPRLLLYIPRFGLPTCLVLCVAVGELNRSLLDASFLGTIAERAKIYRFKSNPNLLNRKHWPSMGDIYTTRLIQTRCTLLISCLCRLWHLPRNRIFYKASANCKAKPLF